MLADLPLIEMTVLAPFVAAMLMLVVGDKPSRIRPLGVLGAFISLVGAVLIAVAYDTQVGGVQMVRTYPLVPDLGINLILGVDGWGVSLLLLTGLIIFAGACASWTVEKRTRDFYVMLLVLVTGVFGVFVSLDLFVFFLFYEVAVLPMYLLIGIWGSPGKVADAGPFKFVWKLLDVGGKEYAAMKLTLMLLIGSALIVAAMLAMFWEAGGTSFDLRHLEATDFSRTTAMWAFPALWIGFGTLAGLWPFHTWSPDGHAAAPTAVSMLHAGVLMKLGAFGVMRIGMMLLPEGAREWAWVVGTVACVNILYGALCAMSQKDLKYIIAYSSVSHMGVVLLGAATLTVNGWNGAVYQMFAHGLMTGLFFALVGLVYARTHSRWIPDFGGFAAKAPFIATFFTIGCLSSLGLPALAGFVAEWLVFLGAWQSATPWWSVVGLLGAWVTAVYVLRATKQIFWGEGPDEKWHELSDPRGSEWIALWVLGLSLIVFGVAPGLVLDFIDIATTEYLPRVAGTDLGALLTEVVR
jgi:NADH-quinone oxidoreductase subunit M